MEEIFKAIDDQLTTLKDDRKDMQTASWAYREGVLLTGDEARQILDFIMHHNGKSSGEV